MNQHIHFLRGAAFKKESYATPDPRLSQKSIPSEVTVILWKMLQIRGISLLCQLLIGPRYGDLGQLGQDKPVSG